jgi:hypothetical protein
MRRKKIHVQAIYALKQSMAHTAPIFIQLLPNGFHGVTSFQIATKKGEIVFTPLIQAWLFSAQIFTQIVIYESYRETVKYRISPNAFEKCGNLSRFFILPLELQLYRESAHFCGTHSSLTTFGKELTHRVS